jgi:hypothetical protein
MPVVRTRRLILRVLIAAAGTIAAVTPSTGCGPAVDLAKGLEIHNVSTGWYDAGIVNGENKIVPSVTFTLKNVSNRSLAPLQVNALFRLVNDPAEWGSAFLTAADSHGLAPGAETPVLTMRSQQGYTSTDPRQDMLHNSHFVDAKVELSAKYGSGQWTRIGAYQIGRQLLAH